MVTLDLARYPAAMYWDDLMRRVRREHRGNSQELLSGAAGRVATPQGPPPRRRSLTPPAWLAWTSVLLLAGIGIVYILWPTEVAALIGL